MSDPRAEYGRRLAEFTAAYAACERRHIQLGPVNLGVVALGLLLLWFVVIQRSVDVYWLIAPVAVYGGLALAHEFVLRRRRVAQTAIDLYRRGIARIDDKWAGVGATGEEFREENHVYADDLDLFGDGCLFQLLSTARLPMGEKRLAEWLKRGAAVEEAEERQKVVAELSQKLDLHCDLAITGESLRTRIVPDALVEWAEVKTVLPGTAWRAIAIVLALAAAAGIAYYAEGGSKWPLMYVLAVEGALLGWLRKKSTEAIAKIDCNAEGLELFSRVLGRFEREPFVSERLKRMAAELRFGVDGGSQGRNASGGVVAGGPTQKAGSTDADDVRLVVGSKPAPLKPTLRGSGQASAAPTASEAVRRLARIVYWVDARENLLLKMAELPFLYTLQVAFAAEAWKRRHGRRMRRWLEIAGEMEALVSLSTYAYEHPADVFAEFVDAGAGARLDGEELGHPLLAADKCVRNSVLLDAGTQLLLVSGSNMSGKSTLLRTVGINAVLAMAGAPIRGARMRLTPLTVGTRIRSGDSLQEGRSNFYTEILHIRRVFDLMGKSEPLLFLFDELLDGTNSHDRRIAAEKLLRTLVDGGAIGMVTTHDLALTEIGAVIGAGLKNVHFEDQVADGKMRFDYRLRDGVVTKSNAIELMRIIGLDV